MTIGLQIVLERPNHMKVGKWRFQKSQKDGTNGEKLSYLILSHQYENSPRMFQNHLFKVGVQTLEKNKKKKILWLSQEAKAPSLPFYRRPMTFQRCFIIFYIIKKQNTQLEDIVSWNEDGTGFLVKNVLAFQDQVLPMYFKHRNFASFVRQMNMYGFHKSRSDYKENEFVHPYFKKDQRQLLKKIKRKSSDHDEQLAILDLKPHRTHNSQEINDLISKQHDLEKICKILIDQNNKILQYNKLLRQQLVHEKYNIFQYFFLSILE